MFSKFAGLVYYSSLLPRRTLGLGTKKAYNWNIAELSLPITCLAPRLIGGVFALEVHCRPEDSVPLRSVASP